MFQKDLVLHTIAGIRAGNDMRKHHEIWPENTDLGVSILIKNCQFWQKNDVSESGFFGQISWVFAMGTRMYVGYDSGQKTCIKITFFVWRENFLYFQVIFVQMHSKNRKKNFFNKCCFLAPSAEISADTKKKSENFLEIFHFLAQISWLCDSKTGGFFPYAYNV